MELDKLSFKMSNSYEIIFFFTYRSRYLKLFLVLEGHLQDNRIKINFKLLGGLIQIYFLTIVNKEKFIQITKILISILVL